MKKQIPNFITLGNLLCGILACIAAVNGGLAEAALLICLGIFLDFFDGLAARLLNVASPLGKELDSLADVVTSGVAPGIILFVILSEGSEFVAVFSLLALLMPLFAAYRLAKFNLDTRQSHSFLGLPVPANALIWVGLALFIDPNNCSCELCREYEWSPILKSELFLAGLLIISFITNILMISEIPMFSLKFNFKDMSWESNSTQYIFLIGCAIIIALTRQWYCISLIILWYILFSILTRKKNNA